MGTMWSPKLIEHDRAYYVSYENPSHGKGIETADDQFEHSMPYCYC